MISVVDHGSNTGKFEEYHINHVDGFELLCALYGYYFPFMPEIYKGPELVNIVNNVHELRGFSKYQTKHLLMAIHSGAKHLKALEHIAHTTGFDYEDGKQTAEARRTYQGLGEFLKVRFKG